MTEVVTAVLIALAVAGLLLKLWRDDRSGALDDPGPLKGIGKSGEPGDDPSRRGRAS